MIAILSDIHGNLYALEAVINDMYSHDINGIMLLGDLIDYGQQSNEVVEYLSTKIHTPIICNLWGNHEKAILENDYSRFSSERGQISARYTESILTHRTREYLSKSCSQTCFREFELNKKHCLAVHGSLEDTAWSGIIPDDLHGNYRAYDIVFSGHTHYSHCFTKFYDSCDAAMRNKKAVLFINPGSVGQPRNHNPNAQYALIDVDTWSVYLRSVKYDIVGAMNLFHGQVDDFYRSRLEKGV